jgi:hypothetical protein
MARERNGLVKLNESYAYGFNRQQSINLHEYKYQRVQPKSWRISYYLKPQFVSSNYEGELSGMKGNLQWRNMGGSKMKKK